MAYAIGVLVAKGRIKAFSPGTSLILSDSAVLVTIYLPSTKPGLLKGEAQYISRIIWSED